MSQSDKEFQKAMYLRQKAGYEYLEAERLAELRNTVTKHVLPTLNSAFRYTLTLPARPDSGFVEFYRVLARSRK